MEGLERAYIIRLHFVDFARCLFVKYAIPLGIALILVWLVWSGQTQLWLLALGLFSTVFVLCIVNAMRIMDSETVPSWIAWPRMTTYLIWLAKEVVKSNVDVAKRVLSPSLPISPKMIQVTASQRTELGRVILANSITLTPGTVSVELQKDHVEVHALSHEGAEEDLSGGMNRRVANLEGLA